MNICKNCRHFNPIPNIAPFGTCQSSKMVYNSAYKGIPNEVAPDTLVYMDGDGYDAQPCVGEDFGCVHFKAIPLTSEVKAAKQIELLTKFVENLVSNYDHECFDSGGCYDGCRVCKAEQALKEFSQLEIE